MSPIDMPAAPSGIARVRFDIDRVDFAAPEAAGRQGGVQAGWPLWSALFELDASDPVSAELWQAFIDRMKGRLGRFMGRDPSRPFPRAYPGGFGGMVRAGGGAFNGAAASWAQHSGGANGYPYVTFTGLPAYLKLNLGDYVGLKWDRAGDPAGSYLGRTMMRINADPPVYGDGSGYFYADPPIDTRVVPPGAILHFDLPCCVMQLVPEKSSLAPVGRGGAISGGSIVAIQDLRP